MALEQQSGDWNPGLHGAKGKLPLEQSLRQKSCDLGTGKAWRGEEAGLSLEVSGPSGTLCVHGADFLVIEHLGSETC